MIIFVFECMMLGFVSWLVGIFYNYTLENNHIFGKIGAVLNYWVDLPDEIVDAGFYPKPIDKFKAWIANPLGACIYCSTTWITIFIMILYWLSWSNSPKWEDIIIGTLAAIGMQHVLLRLWCYTKNHVEEK